MSDPAGLSALKKDAATLHMLSFSADYEEFAGAAISMALRVLDAANEQFPDDVKAAWEIVKRDLEKALAINA